MARSTRYDVNKDYYEILGISEDASIGDVLAAYNEAIKELQSDKTISREDYEEDYELLTEAADILSNSTERAAYDRDRKALVVSDNNSRVKVENIEDDEEVAEKGRSKVATAALAILCAAAILAAGIGIGKNVGKNNTKDNSKTDTVTEQSIDEDTNEETKEEKTNVKNFGDPTKKEDVQKRVSEVKAQLNDLGVINFQTGLPYSEEELTAIIQYVNGAFKPEKEADAYTMVDEYLNFVCGIISAPKTLNMVQYQANSDVITESMVQNDIDSTKPFDFTSLLMGDSYCYESIEHFNDCYAKLLSTTDRDEFKRVHDETYLALAELTFGDGHSVNGRKYKIQNYSGLGNQNDAVVLWSLVMSIEPFSVQGIQEEFTINYSQAGETIIPIKEIKEQFNVLCAPEELTVDNTGSVALSEPSNFATNTEVLMINSALQNAYLNNTDAYQNGYQYTKKNN